MVDPHLFAPFSLALIGPTGSGKTEVARRLVSTFPMSFICMDSMQLYGELSIGTASPGCEDKGSAPHYLFGSHKVSRPISAAQYAEQASQCAFDLVQRGMTPLFIGGTGLYYRALFDPLTGLPATPHRLRERLDRLVERKGLNHLYRILERLDPEAAQSLHPHDRQRIQRFLEVRVATGTGIHDFWRRQEISKRCHPITIGLEMARDVLWARLSERCEKMFDGGWVAESEALIAAGLEQSVRQLAPIGYGLIFDFLHGRCSRPECLERIFVTTRQYAKRQMTWFKKVPDVVWVQYSTCSGYPLEDMIKSIIDVPRIGL